MIDGFESTFGRRRAGPVEALVVLAVLAALIAGAVSLLSSCGGPFLLHASFRSARELRQGDPVLVRGIQVGQVVDVRFQDDGEARVHVTAEILDEHVSRVREGAAMFIVEPWILDGRRSVEILVPDAARAPVADGTKLDALDSRWQRLEWQSVNWVTGTAGDVMSWAEEKIADRAAR